jgi:hypothetical protein
MKIRRGSIFIENNRSKRGVERSRICWSVEYAIVGCEVVATFTIIFKVQRRQNIQ